MNKDEAMKLKLGNKVARITNGVVKAGHVYSVVRKAVGKKKDPAYFRLEAKSPFAHVIITPKNAAYFGVMK